MKKKKKVILHCSSATNGLYQNDLFVNLIFVKYRRKFSKKPDHFYLLFTHNKKCLYFLGLLVLEKKSCTLYIPAVQLCKPTNTDLLPLGWSCQLFLLCTKCDTGNHYFFLNNALSCKRHYCLPCTYAPCIRYFFWYSSDSLARRHFSWPKPSIVIAPASVFCIALIDLYLILMDETDLLFPVLTTTECCMCAAWAVMKSAHWDFQRSCLLQLLFYTSLFIALFFSASAKIVSCRN